MGGKVVDSSSSKGVVTGQARAGKAESGNAAESHVGKCGGGGVGGKPAKARAEAHQGMWTLSCRQGGAIGWWC